MSNVFIGLPVHNGESFLTQAIESLLAQTYGDFTLLIADNASTDGTEAICRRFAALDRRIDYRRHAKNLGAAPNFNLCLREARGKYFKWAAHDDLCRPTYLERCVELLERDPGAVLAQAQVLPIDDAGRLGEPYLKERDFNHPDPARRFARAMALDHACVSVFGLMRLEVLRKTAAIAPFVGSDRTLLAELALHGRIEYVPEPLFLWREHQSRSVKIRRRDRAAWFQTDANAVSASLYSRQILANLRAVLRAPQPVRVKLRGLATTLAWTLRSRARLLRDLRATAGSLFLRVSR